jgi:serine/threonine protein kinase
MERSVACKYEERRGLRRIWKSGFLFLYKTSLCVSETENSDVILEISLEKISSVSRESETERPYILCIKECKRHCFALSSEEELESWMAMCQGKRRPAARVSLEDFEILGRLGTGGTGSVKQVRYKGDGAIYAMKVIPKALLTDVELAERIIVEKETLITNQHPFLVGAKFAFQDPTRLYIVMEFVQGGELYERLIADSSFSIERSRLYAAELALGLGHLHSLGLIHRDLKPENILLDSDGHIKIADFGLVKSNMGSGATTTTFCGTPDYISPEVIAGDPYNKSADWWSYGCLVYEMLVGRPPFVDDDQMTAYRSVLRDPVPIYPPLDQNIVIRDFLMALLEKNQKKRLGSGGTDVEEVKSHPFFDGIDWNMVLRKEITMPWKPVISDALDRSLFSEAEEIQSPVPLFDDDVKIPSVVQSELVGFSIVSSAFSGDE